MAIDELPAACIWCGAPLMGGLTVHRPACWLAGLQHGLAAALDLPPDLYLEFEQAPLPRCDRSPIAALRLAAAACECRSCGHRAASHIAGACFECGRADCWS